MKTFKRYWFWLLLCAFLCCFGCTGSKYDFVHYQNDSLYFDSVSFSGHQYVVVKYNLPYYGGESTNNFQVLHSPDCQCRYNRTFIVVKRGK